MARSAWRLIHTDSARALEVAERAIAAAVATGDIGAEGWGRLARGMHRLYYATPTQAAREIRLATRRLAAVGDRAGQVLAGALLARSMWRQGRYRQALAKVLPLRDEGVRLLRHEQRGVLLNAIAGCYSVQGDSAQAFAYMYEALRDAGPRSGHGFDTVLHCNLSHELLQIGDYEEALRHVEQGLARGQRLRNPRLLSVLRINRVICLTELGRPAESLADIDALLALPADPSGRGQTAAHYEALAIAALLAGQTALGAQLVARAQAQGEPTLPEECVERALADALLAQAQRGAGAAVRALLPLRTLADTDGVIGLHVRVRLQFFAALSDAQARAGHPKAALASLRRWQQLHRAQSQLASHARYQAAALQTEVLRLQHRLDENDAQRRATEKARAELAAINAQLSRKVEEVQALQEALRQQATQDPLTGLFNRRHLNETLPTLFAMARRDRQPLSLVIVDLDHFKSINDLHGHAAGDRLLERFGEMVAGHCRGGDVACRYGGEEFCLLLPHTGAEGARRKVQLLLRRWRDEVFDLEGARLQGLSFSAGIADTDSVPGSPDALLKAADDRLLDAKRAGRNRVGVATTA
ncbi:MAG: diguanylate cyclase [Rubrivivax sp.]|nr:diguanylate cyclase [Rubrivivax sp.]MDH5338540.1 diguanylate cyclase [Rubrivivax sp.]